MREKNNYTLCKEALIVTDFMIHKFFVFAVEQDFWLNVSLYQGVCHFLKKGKQDEIKPKHNIVYI
jgi:hypothetical protein